MSCASFVATMSLSAAISRAFLRAMSFISSSTEAARRSARVVRVSSMTYSSVTCVSFSRFRASSSLACESCLRTCITEEQRGRHLGGGGCCWQRSLCQTCSSVPASAWSPSASRDEAC